MKLAGQRAPVTRCRAFARLLNRLPSTASARETAPSPLTHPWTSPLRQQRHGSRISRMSVTSSATNPTCGAATEPRPLQRPNDSTSTPTRDGLSSPGLSRRRRQRHHPAGASAGRKVHYPPCAQALRGLPAGFVARHEGPGWSLATGDGGLPGRRCPVDVRCGRPLCCGMVGVSGWTTCVRVRCWRAAWMGRPGSCHQHQPDHAELDLVDSHGRSIPGSQGATGHLPARGRRSRADRGASDPRAKAPRSAAHRPRDTPRDTAEQVAGRLAILGDGDRLPYQDGRRLRHGGQL